jgi:regulator of replication initiation timing
MGLFSGSFGTGLVTGLATSVDKSLRTAMDKRDKELSAARTFWQQRQAQKMDAAEARDKRTNSALDRMIDEMGGDVAGGVAAFKAAGGDVDQVEAFIAALDETRNAGLEYNVQDKLKLDGVDLSQYGDLTRERAYKGFATEVKGVDIQMQDMSGLANLGLGMKDMGKGISESINKLIPAREREAIEGITGGVLDRSGLITSERYKREVVAAVPNMKTQMSANLYQINNGKDLMGKDLTEADVTRLEMENAKLLTQIGGIAKAEAAATDSGPSLSAISGSYRDGLSRLQKDLGFDINSSTGIMTIQPPGGELLEGAEAQSYWKQQKNAWKSDFVKTNIFDESGGYVSNDADFAARSLGLGDIASSVRESLVQAPPADDTPPPAASASEAPKTAADAGFGTAKDVKNNPIGYINAVRTNNTNITDGELRMALIQSGVPMYEVDELIPFDASAQPQ